MFCLRRILYDVPAKIIKGYTFESRRAINLIPKIFRKRKLTFPPDFDVKEYKPIYRFKLAGVFCGFSKRKNFYYVSSLLVIFGCSICSHLEYIDNDTFKFFVLLCVWNVVLIALVTGLGKNVIGKVYANKDFSKLIIAYGNSSGKRINKFYEPQHLMIQDHPNPIYKGLCKRITVKDTEFHLNLCNFLTDKDELSFYKVFPSDI